MKVIFVLGSTDLGGAEHQAIILANELMHRSNYDIKFILFGKNRGMACSKLESFFIPYYTLKHPNSRFGILKYIRLINFIFLLRKLRPNVLMPYTTYPNIYTSLIWKYTKANYCLWNQRDEGIELYVNRSTTRAVNNASGYIANSNSAKKYLINAFNVTSSKVAVIHNGLSILEVFFDKNSWRKKFAFDQDEVLICMIANLTKHKNHDTLLRAFQIVMKKYNEKPIKLILAGKFGDNYKFLHNLALELNIIKNVAFLGKIDDIGSLLNAIDLSVLSSYSEGLPNVIIESMLAGVPITGSKIQGLIETLGEDYQEFLSTPGDDHDLAEKILYFLNNPSVANNLVMKNKIRALSHFSLDNLYGETNRCFMISEYEKGVEKIVVK
jgi:glycosyltransferase involved in cell wall biosynthesis